ncbi:hypothetical protein [Nocardia heshunensis]
MSCDDADSIEIQVVQDILEVVEARLREWEGCGWWLSVPRWRVFAVVLHAVIVSARETHGCRATLDRAQVLDAIFDGVESPNGANVANPVDCVIRRHGVNAN